MDGLHFSHFNFGVHSKFDTTLDAHSCINKSCCCLGAIFRIPLSHVVRHFSDSCSVTVNKCMEYLLQKLSWLVSVSGCVLKFYEYYMLS